MGKHSLPPVKEDISPNVVPMIDIMFLLLLFFMLGADMSQRESVEVKLPVADMVKEDKGDDVTGDPETTVNIHPDGMAPAEIFADPRASRDKKYWKISLRGEEYTIERLKTQLKIEADEFLEPGIDAQAGRQLSRKKVLIRAEREAPFGLVQKVIETCGSVGLYKVEVAGSKPTPTAGSGAAPKQ